jgi:hypothetical protein
MKTAIKILSLAVALATSTGAAQAAKYSEVSVTNGGTISGAVSAGDNTAVTKSYTISKDTDICGEGIRDVDFVRVNGAMLQDAVVFLKGVKEGKAFPEDLSTLTITQKGCQFSPMLGVMRNKGDLVAINLDPTLHNIHTYEQIGTARRSVMNVSQPNQNDEVTKTVKLRKGNGMKIECDAHDFMHGFAFVAKNPYFSVVDENGNFTIGDVPAGKYKLMVWHGYLGEIEGGEVEVGEGGEMTVNLSY